MTSTLKFPRLGYLICTRLGVAFTRCLQYSAGKIRSSNWHLLYLSHGNLGNRKSLLVYEKVKRMNASDLRDKTPDQLRDELANLKRESFNLRFQQATGQLENTARMRAVRRKTARVKTVLNEKAAAAAE